MRHYTMLAEPAAPIVAIDKLMAREDAALLSKQYGDIKVEVWKYSPLLLSENGIVDRLSLYLSMRDSDDERILVGVAERTTLDNLLYEIAARDRARISHHIGMFEGERHEPVG